MKAGLIVVKVFIGYSGKTGGKIAPILGNWLRRTFDDRITVFSSDFSTEASAFVMRDSLEEMINDADCALLCVTADSVNSPRLAYVAGKFRKDAQLLLLFGVDASRLDAIFHGFHVISLRFDHMQELTRTLNRGLGKDALPAEELERRFPERYPVLEGLVQETLSENEAQTREDWERNELNEISAQLAELTKRVERLKTNISDAKAPRKHSYRKTSRYM